METDKNKPFSGIHIPSEKTKVSPSTKKVTITFRENRKFHLHIGRNVMVFKGRQSKQIPEDWLTHKDWPSVSSYFIVKGV